MACCRTRNIRGWKFSWFRDSMYYENISRLKLSWLAVHMYITTKISILSNSPNCALNTIDGVQWDGGTSKAKQYTRWSQSTSKMDVLAICHMLTTWRVNWIPWIKISAVRPQQPKVQKFVEHENFSSYDAFNAEFLMSDQLNADVL